MQPAVESLVKLGRFPPSPGAPIELIQSIEAQLPNVRMPVTDDEARALVQLFGPDDCFGLAWSLAHLIETAPGWPLQDCLRTEGNRWIDLLRDSAKR